MYLDDLKYIHSKDTADTLGIAEKLGSQLGHIFHAADAKPFTQVEAVIYACMGGSSVAGMLAEACFDLPKPFQVVRDYDIPAYANDRTLFIAASYSGNSEETLSALAQAEAKGCQIAVITAGGRLREIAEEKGYLLLLLPKVAQPRFAILYNFRALMIILKKAGLIELDVCATLAPVEAFLNKATAGWRADAATRHNPAKQLAQELMGRSVVVYSGPKLFPAAYKWKLAINENAKQLAWVNQLPEFSHNEFMGWTQQPTDKPYAVVELRSGLEHERTQKRFMLTERLLSGKRPAVHRIDVRGATALEQLLWAVAFGEHVSIYLALLNGLDPAPLELVDTFKKEMDA